MIDENALPVTARLKKRRRSKFSFPLWALFILVLIAAIVVAGVLAMRSPALVGTAEKREVRAFLSENLDTPDWDEVKWYPTVTWNGSKYVRVKIRSKNKFGASELIDLVFQIDKDKIRCHGDDRGYWFLWNES